MLRCSSDDDNALLCKTRILHATHGAVCDFQYSILFAFAVSSFVCRFVCEYNSISLYFSCVADFRNFESLTLRIAGEKVQFVQILICGALLVVREFLLKTFLLFALFCFFLLFFLGVFQFHFTIQHLPGRHGLVADPNDDFNCEKPAKHRVDIHVLAISFSSEV